MPLFIVYGSIVSLLMLLIEASAFLSPGGLSGDASIEFTMLALAGIPAWLIVAALTIKRWKYVPRKKAMLYNLPALVSAASYGYAYIWWAK